jgi:hypothetical protein
VNIGKFEQSTSVSSLFETRLGNSEIFNGTVASDDNGEFKKLQYSNPVKLWNCNAVFDYTSSVDNHAQVKADTVQKTNADRRLF